VGTWLVDQRAGLDRGEAEWLERLAGFDREGLWALDGHLSCVTWLVWRTNMGRSTAFEKLRVAHELERRPIIAEAFRRGDLSYSAVRAVTRMERPAPEVDQAMVELARSGQASILDIEKMARTYMLYADQERAPADEVSAARDVRIKRDGQGGGQIIITLSDLEVEEFASALQAFIDLAYRPVDESPERDLEAPLDEASRPARKADAFVDLVHTALRGADGGHATGDDRYLVHLVQHDNHPGLTFLDTTPLHPADAAMIACDAATVAHTVTESGEPLNLGRKTREWNTAQRRAISVRDGGHCRFLGCSHHHYDIHHVREWETGGATDIANGMCVCRRHHRMLHSGYQVKGDPNHQLHFHRSDGSYIGTTQPSANRAPQLMLR